MSVAGFPPELTPQAGFSLWYNSIQARWSDLAVARAAWSARVAASLPGGPAAYPQRSAAEALDAMPIQMFDPVPWPQNPSCPYGT
jgi:hypothetical protein